MELTRRYISHEEILTKIAEKQKWISFSLQRMEMLPREEQYSMWNHLTDLRRELGVLEDMERTASRGIPVCRSRIYWEPTMVSQEDITDDVDIPVKRFG